MTEPANPPGGIGDSRPDFNDILLAQQADMAADQEAKRAALLADLNRKIEIADLKGLPAHQRPF